MDRYNGRLSCDGRGNLLAHEARQIGTRTVLVHNADGEPEYDEDGKEITIELPVFKYGKNHNKLVAFDPDVDGHIFIEGDEPSHNERHQNGQLIEMTGTQDLTPDLPGYAGTPDNPTPGCEHHWGALPGDVHYHGLIQDSDEDAVTASSHTNQGRAS
jgi:hypothetical protein